MTMAEEPPTEHKVPFRIGYALAQKKTQSFLQEKLCRESLNKGVQLIQIDLTRSLREQGPFDAILHKINRQEWYDELASYQLSHPDVLVVDPPEAIQRLYNRLSMLQVVGERRVYDSGCSVGVPRQIFVDDRNHLIEKFEASGLEFPVIAKPLVVDGTHKSHIMWLVYNEEGLRKLAPPLVIQEFVNHGGVIFKVFVVGGAVRCVRRHSLPGKRLLFPQRIGESCQCASVHIQRMRYSWYLCTGCLLWAYVSLSLLGSYTTPRLAALIFQPVLCLIGDVQTRWTRISTIQMA